MEKEKEKETDEKQNTGPLLPCFPGHASYLLGLGLD